MTPRNVQEGGETTAASGHPGKGEHHALSSSPLLKLCYSSDSPLPAGTLVAPFTELPRGQCSGVVPVALMVSAFSLSQKKKSNLSSLKALLSESSSNPAES